MTYFKNYIILFGGELSIYVIGEPECYITRVSY